MTIFRKDDVEELEEPKCIKRVFKADLLLDDPDVDEDNEDEDDKEEDVDVMEAGSRLRLSGRTALRVFLHPEATVQEAVWALKEDAMRTITARLDIHADTLVGEGGEAKWQEQTNVS